MSSSKTKFSALRMRSLLAALVGYFKVAFRVLALIVFYGALAIFSVFAISAVIAIIVLAVVSITSNIETRESDLKKAATAADMSWDAYSYYWCHLQKLCSKFSSYRQECAVAGDFMNCLRVKTGTDSNLLDQCRDRRQSKISSGDYARRS